MKILKLSSVIVLLAALFFSCQKEYSFEKVITPAGTWEFNDSSKQYIGNMDTAYIQTIAPSTKIMTLMGRTANGQQTFLLHLYATDSFTVGTYKASLSQTDFQYYSTAKNIYQADQFIGEFIVVVTALGNNQITGTFSGTSQDSSGAIKQLTLGKFTSRINLSGNGTGGGGGGTATGTLGASAGTCTPTSATGTYTQGVSLTSGNTVTVTVTVTTPGTYTIATNTVNGVSFSKTGTFTTAGVQTITLNGAGTPINSGNQTFTVTFGSSTCNFPINFGAGTPPATGTLGGSPGSCTTATQAGTYTQGTALTSANTVTVQVNVTTVGAYTISTNTVNGVSFSNTGTFTATGVQNVVLNGTGTPVNSGVQNFIITFGSSTCNFSITFAAGTPLPPDYFPTTLNSNWTYAIGSTPTDSILNKVIAYSPNFSGQTYSSITEDVYPLTGIPNDTLYYRKPGGDYYQYINVKDFFGFDNPGTPATGEFIFLKDNVAQGTTWNSPTFSGPFMNVTYTIFIKMTLKEKAVTATVGSLPPFTDVIKVTYEYFVNGVTTSYIEERWFQKGVGLINYFDNDVPPFSQKIARWQVF
ncbi:MAG TPA: hypothetical protein VGP43_03520 [Chitinophagaceae bacterium]|nr:hypothetical protein [Chitinophagaceae bacterium]